MDWSGSFSAAWGGRGRDSFCAWHGVWVGVPSFFEGGHFFGIEHAPFAWAETIEPDGADADAPEAFDLIAAVIHHQADLPFDALEEDDSESVGAFHRDALHFCASAFDVESAEKFFAVGGFEGSVEEDLVFLFDFVAWMGECEGEIAVVGDDEEAFAFFVEASDIVNAGPIVGDEIEDGASPGFVGGGADEAFWFVDDGVDVLL